MLAFSNRKNTRELIIRTYSRQQELATITHAAQQIIEKLKISWCCFMLAHTKVMLFYQTAGQHISIVLTSQHCCSGDSY